MDHKIERIASGFYKITLSDKREFLVDRDSFRGKPRGWRWRSVIFQTPEVEQSGYGTYIAARDAALKWAEEHPIKPLFPCCDSMKHAIEEMFIFYEPDKGDVSPDYHRLMITERGGWHEFMFLNFCPFCGKKIPYDQMENDHPVFNGGFRG